MKPITAADFSVRGIIIMQDAYGEINIVRRRISDLMVRL